MAVDYYKLLFKYLIIIILAIFIKVAINIQIENDTGIEVFYKNVSMLNDKVNFKKPYFNDDTLNDLVDSYIVDNSCQNLDYNVFKINKSEVNVYLDCGRKESFIYNSKTKGEVSILSIIKNEKKFTKKLKKLLFLKYPKYITDSVSVTDGIYNIKDNEIIAYYKNDTGDIDIKINNNEIKNLMDYEMVYDEKYKNENWEPDLNKKHIAFTFDDGPSSYDNKIIELLNDYHATATFFVVGNRIDSFPAEIKKMVDSGMEVGNHTFDHKYLGNLSDDEVINEFNMANNTYKNITGKDMEVIRPSYGAIKQSALDKMGKSSILWDIDTLDWKTRDTNKIYEEIMKNPQDGDIVLMHSLYESTANAVELSLKDLYSKGFEVVSVENLFKIKGKAYEPGKTYRSAS